MVQLKLVPVVTKNLFSKHYLEDRILHHSRWEKPVEYKDYFKKIKDVYLKEKNHVAGYNEGQLERYFIWPILKILGHRFEIQEKSDESALTPDYAFFESDNARLEARQRIGGSQFYKTAIAIGDAKKWGLPMDKKVKGKKKYDFFNPSFQIDVYLRENNKDWGILTNGKLWRLYYKGTSQKLDSYYEVDLETILESDDLSGFRYFYVFFEKEAFIRDETGKNFLDKVYGEGLSYSKKIGEDLQKNIYEALRTLSQGFLSYPGNSLGNDETTIKLIHDNSLIYLYRLLFILYADARGMIQTKKEGHEAYDIDKIKSQVFTRKQGGKLSEYSTETWDRLNNLFKLIDKGSESISLPKEEIYVPPYNGGLFDIERYPFLNDYKVGDKAIADVLEYVTMSEDESGKDFIDYSNLEIRHLGSVYEGLLEYRLKIAETDMFVKKTKKGEVWESREKFDGDFDTLPDGRKVKQGDIYLATDKGERKATGSYYTPDYIVEYIVENTLGPVVDEKIKGIPDGEKVGAILSIRVLDPAMGSGHFLVEASNYLARRIAEFVKPEDIGGASEIGWARREAVKKCIYGVDLNLLAMELAKLSLWLDSLEGDRPLSFLDHHIKTGNSLIGADIKNLNSHPKEAEGKTAPTFISDFLDETVREKIKIFVSMHLTIMRMAEEDIADIKAKEATYRQFESDLFRQVFVQLANLHTSYWLGNKFTKEEYYAVLEAFRQFSHDRSKWEAVKEEEYFKKAQKLAEEKRFFNWELAFPDIFYGESEENPGFDAVIGNPPWGAEFDDDMKKYLALNCDSGGSSTKDSYGVFTELAIKQTADKKLCSYIIPDTFLRKDDLISLRDYIFKTVSVNEFLETGPLFKNVRDTWCLVFNFSKAKPSEKHMIQHKQISRFVVSAEERLELFGRKEWARETAVRQVHWMNRPSKIVGYLSSTNEQNIIEHIENTSMSLGQLSDKFLISRGEEGSKKKFEVGTNEDFYLVLPEHIERFSTSGGRPVVKDNLTQTKLNDYYIHPKIWVIRIQKLRWKQRIVASFDDKTNSAGMKTLQIIISANDDILDLQFLCSIICSKLVNYWCTDYLVDDMNQSYLEKLPIRRISFTTPEDEITKLVSDLKESYTGSNFSEILLCVESYLPKDKGGNFVTDEEKSDVIHDFLAFLAEQMIEMNKEKNNKIKDFLEWLEHETGAKIDGLNNRTAIKRYYKYDFNKLMEILKKNKSKLQVDPGRLQVRNNLKEGFETSTNELSPLIEKINKTDWLIDQIVYKLYGLTDEEIKIVEGDI